MAFQCTAELFGYGSAQVVMTQPPGAGSPIGKVAAQLIGRSRQMKAERPQWRRLGPAEVVIHDLGVSITWREGQEQLPFGTITAYRRGQLGLELNRLTGPPILLGPSLMTPGRPVEQIDQLSGWFAHFSHRKLWTEPRFEIARAERSPTSWCQMDPRFVFGLPPGWRPADEAIMAGMGTTVVAAAQRPAANGSRAFMGVVDLCGVPDVTPMCVEYAVQTAESLAESLSGSVTGPITYLEVGRGGRAALMPITAFVIAEPELPRGAKLEETHVVMTINGTVFSLRFAVIPTDNAPIPTHQDRTDLMTMLATWDWRSP